MKLETIKERIRIGRFRPFEVHLSDGKVVNVLHPDFILFAPSSEEFDRRHSGQRLQHHCRRRSNPHPTLAGEA